jgi:hypothetical protein
MAISLDMASSRAEPVEHLQLETLMAASEVEQERTPIILAVVPVVATQVAAHHTMVTATQVAAAVLSLPVRC